MTMRRYLVAYQFLGPNGAQGYGNDVMLLDADEEGLPYWSAIQNAQDKLADESGIDRGKLLITNLVRLAN